MFLYILLFFSVPLIDLWSRVAPIRVFRIATAFERMHIRKNVSRTFFENLTGHQTSCSNLQLAAIKSESGFLCPFRFSLSENCGKALLCLRGFPRVSMSSFMHRHKDVTKWHLARFLSLLCKVCSILRTASGLVSFLGIFVLIFDFATHSSKFKTTRFVMKAWNISGWESHVWCFVFSKCDFN